MHAYLGTTWVSANLKVTETFIYLFETSIHDYEKINQFQGSEPRRKTLSCLTNLKWKLKGLTTQQFS